MKWYVLRRSLKKVHSEQIQNTVFDMFKNLLWVPIVNFLQQEMTYS